MMLKCCLVSDGAGHCPDTSEEAGGTRGSGALLGQVTSQIGWEGWVGISPWRSGKVERIGNILKRKNIIHNIPEWESTVLRLEPRRQNDLGPNPTGLIRHIRLPDFIPMVLNRSDTINFRLLVDCPGEGRELTGGWQVWSQEKQQKLFQRREVSSQTR